MSAELPVCLVLISPRRMPRLAPCLPGKTSVVLNQGLRRTNHRYYGGQKKEDPYYKPIKQLKKLTLVVVRYDRRGQLCDSKPCQACITLMRVFGIQKVTYSDENGDMITEKVSDIENRPSKGMRGFGIDKLDPRKLRIR